MVQKSLQIEELSLACFFLARLFEAAPDQSTWQDFQAIQKLDWMFSDASKEELNDFSKFQQSLNVALDNLAVDYAQLFIGPDILQAPPWASMYMEQEQIIFGDESADVQKFYEKYHMRQKNKGQEPSDHLALELRFIGTILAHLDQADDQETQQHILHDLQLFLHNHFLPWAPKCLEAVQQHARTDFYRLAAKLGLFTVQKLQYFAA